MREVKKKKKKKKREQCTGNEPKFAYFVTRPAPESIVIS